MFWPFRSGPRRDAGGGEPGHAIPSDAPALPHAPDGNPFSVSRDLYDNLDLCLKHLCHIAGELALKQSVASLRVHPIFVKMKEGQGLDAQETFQMMEFSKRTLLVSNLSRAVFLLENILHDPMVIGNPHFREAGEYSIQLLVTELKTLAENSDLATLGGRVRPNEIETVDASLGQLFRTHGTELQKLMTVPSAGTASK